MTEIHTEDELKYQFQPLERQEVHFQFKGNNDAHLCLTCDECETERMYEIFIGGWKNTKSVIRVDKGDNNVEVQTPDIVSPDEYRGFWIKYKPSKGRILVGHAGDKDPFMVWTDPQPLKPTHLGFSTGWGSDGYWIFQGEADIETSDSSSSDEDSGRKRREAAPRYRQPARWRPASDGGVPQNSIVAGQGNEGDEFVGRAHHEGGLILGKVVPAHGVCYIPWGGQEIAKSEYQVLLNPGFTEVEWVHASGGAKPEGALQGGYTEDGEPLYVGRAEHEGTTTVGKFHPSHNVVYIPYGGGEVPKDEYEILCCKTVPLRK